MALSPDIALWPDQARAFEFGKNKKAVGLSMSMSTGKTLTVAALVDVWRPRTILIVATEKISQDPKIWKRHLQQFISEPYRVEVLTGRPPQERCNLYTKSPPVPTAYLINKESVWREPLATKLLRIPPALLVIDESHHAKAPAGVFSRFMFRLAQRCERKVLATGTMLSHTPLDAWMQTRILNNAVFDGSFLRFKKQYAHLGGYMGKEVLSGKNSVPWKNQPQLARILSRMWFTCEKPILPFDVQRVTRQFDLSEKAQEVYHRLERDFALTVDGQRVSAPIAITRLVRILQICSGFVRADAMPGDVTKRDLPLDDGRMKLLSEILQEIDPTEKISAIVSKFTYDLNSIRAACEIAERPYFEISGRASEYDKWVKSEGGVIGVHIKSGGEGLDLTAARYGIMYSHQHSSGPRDQAESRIARFPESREKETRFLIDLVSNTPAELSVLNSLQTGKDVIQSLYRAIRAAT